MTDRTWEETVAAARARGGKVIAPNNLPITCVRHDDMCLEHEHANHPDYKFPVEVVFTGEVPPAPEDWMVDNEGLVGAELEEEWRAGFTSEMHALIYSDGYAAVTLFEACYFLWHLVDGSGVGSIPLPKHAFARFQPGTWVLSPESCKKIAELNP